MEFNTFTTGFMAACVFFIAIKIVKSRAVELIKERNPHMFN